jgi:hypothetical protein
LRIGFVVGRRLRTEALAFRSSLPGSFNAFDATPPRAGLCQNLPHLFDWVMDAATVAKCCFSIHCS